MLGLMNFAICNLDQRYARNPSPELLKQRLDLQAEFDLISTREAEHLLLHNLLLRNKPFSKHL